MQLLCVAFLNPNLVMSGIESGTFDVQSMSSAAELQPLPDGGIGFAEASAVWVVFGFAFVANYFNIRLKCWEMSARQSLRT